LDGRQSVCCAAGIVVQFWAKEKLKSTLVIATCVVRVAYAPPSRLAYSSSMRSSYSLSASFSCSVFSVWPELATLCVEVVLVFCAACSEEDVDFSVVECIGTGIMMVMCGRYWVVV
jgi:hypothetical protein